MARQAAALATEILAAHEARYGQKVGRVQIVLVDTDDDPNGFASPLPYPLVTIRAVAPDGTDDFGNHEGWLRLVLTHELAHTVHLEEARGLWGFGRKVFGRAPFLFPNTLAMSWMIEGLATYEETERRPSAAAATRTRGWSCAWPRSRGASRRRTGPIYALDAWPGGLTPVPLRRGLPAPAERAGGRGHDPADGPPARGAVPALPRRPHGAQGDRHRPPRPVEGVGRGGDRRASRRTPRRGRARGPDGVAPRHRRAASGRSRRASAPTAQWVAYTSRTLTRFPEIRLARADGTDDRRLALRNGGLGPRLDAGRQGPRLRRAPGAPDVLGLRRPEPRRRRHGRRAPPDPRRARLRPRRLARRPDGRLRAQDRATARSCSPSASTARGSRPSPASAEGVEWSGPRWSPRGDAVVAARLLPGGWLDLVRVDPATGAVEQLTHDRAKDVEPTWTPDGEAVVFRSDRDGVSNLYALRLADRALAPGHERPRRRLPALGEPRRALGRLLGLLRRRLRHPRRPPRPRRGAPARALRGRAPRPAPRPAAGRGRGPAVPPVLHGPPALLDAVGGPGGRRGPLRRRHRRLGRALPPRLGGAGHLRHRVRARERERLLPLRPLPDELPGERPGRHRRLLGRPPPDAPGQPASARCRSAGPCAPSRPLSATWRREREQVLGSDRPEDRVDLGGIETAWTLDHRPLVPLLDLPVRGRTAPARLAARGARPSAATSRWTS